MGPQRSCGADIAIHRAGFFEADLMAIAPMAPDWISRSVWCGGEPTKHSRLHRVVRLTWSPPRARRALTARMLLIDVVGLGSF